MPFARVDVFCLHAPIHAVHHAVLTLCQVVTAAAYGPDPTRFEQRFKMLLDVRGGREVHAFVYACMAAWRACSRDICASWVPSLFALCLNSWIRYPSHPGVCGPEA